MKCFNSPTYHLFKRVETILSKQKKSLNSSEKSHGEVEENFHIKMQLGAAIVHIKSKRLKIFKH